MQVIRAKLFSRHNRNSKMLLQHSEPSFMLFVVSLFNVSTFSENSL